MKKRNNKKGFTIVELVIVIAVIAILAAVLIPTFSNVVEKANQSAASQAARNFQTAIVSNTAAGAEVKTEGSKTYTLQLDNTGLVVSKSGEGNNLDAEVIVWTLFGEDAKTYEGAKVGMDVTGNLTNENSAGPWTVTAFYVQPKGNDKWAKIDLVGGTVTDYTGEDPAIKCTFDGVKDN